MVARTAQDNSQFIGALEATVGGQLQKDGARKDPDSNMVVHPAVSIAGGYNTVASVMLEAIPYVMSTMSYRSQEYSTDCEDNPFSMHMSNDQ